MYCNINLLSNEAELYIEDYSSKEVGVVGDTDWLIETSWQFCQGWQGFFRHVSRLAMLKCGIIRRMTSHKLSRPKNGELTPKIPPKLNMAENW